MPSIESGNNNGQVTQTTKIGFFERLSGAIKGIFIGLLIFIASFVVLYWNEGRVDSSNFAATAVEVSATVPNTDTNLNGKLVHLGGDLISSAQFGDDTYLKQDKYIALGRKVEMYAWVEESSTKTTTNVGGSQTQETTYTYKQAWTSLPADSSTFNSPNGHTNPIKALADNTWYATDAKVGLYMVDASTLVLPSFQTITLNNQNTMLPSVVTTTQPQIDLLKAVSTSSDGITNEISTSQNQLVQKTELNGNYVYVTKNGVATPTVGDMRVSYSGIMSGTPVTLLGRLDGDKISLMTDPKTGTKLYRAFTGTFTDALGTLHTEYKTSLWILRLIGFLMMWIGLGMVLAPLSIIMDILPFLGSVSRGVIGLVTCVVAIVLSIITIIVSKFLHNPFVLVLVVLGVVVYIFSLIKKAKDKSQTIN
ncbi:MAG: TMEM43 family protein [Candidatus Magasanikbacteria bacterium]